MLECFVIVGNIVVVVVGIGKEVAIHRKDVGARDVGRGQTHTLGLLDFVDLLAIVGKALADLVTQVSVDVLVADDIDGPVHLDGAVVGGKHDFVTVLCHEFEDFKHIGVHEPRLGE